MATIPISFAGGGASGSEDVTASSAQVLKGYTAITSDSDDEPKEGTIPSKSAQTYYASTADQTILSGQYLSGNQTIKAVSQSNLIAENIRKGATISVSNGNGNLWSVAGTYSTPSSGQSPIVAGAIRSGYSGFVNGEGEVRGTIPDQGGGTIYANTSWQTAANAGHYMTGNVSVAPLSQSGLDPANILRNATISISNGSYDVWSVTGSTSGGIKVVSGTVYTTAWFDDGSQEIYKVPVGYADIAPGITPIIVVSICPAEIPVSGIVSTFLQDNYLNYHFYEYVNRFYQTTVDLPRTASQTRVLGVCPQGTWQPLTAYYIYGY